MNRLKRKVSRNTFNASGGIQMYTTVLCTVIMSAWGAFTTTSNERGRVALPRGEHVFLILVRDLVVFLVFYLSEFYFGCLGIGFCV